tara:strand:- start:2350 stop:3222 length:873 start_codon:yes stop_codon:yes gene_type:complete
MANYTNRTNVGMDTASATASDQVGGGVVGAMGAVPSSTSLDLPPAIQRLLDMPTAGVDPGTIGQIQTGPVAQDPNYAASGLNMQPTYQEGGMVGPGGMPMRPAGIQPQQGAAVDPQMLEMQVNELMSQNPEAVARIRAGIEAGIQSGELDVNELNTIIQLAKTVMQNPEMYPQIRQMAISKGIATEADLPVQFDQGLIIAIIAAGKSMEADVQIEGGQAPMPQPQTQVQEMEFGGMVSGPSHDQGGVRVQMKNGGEIEVEGGEYVIPKDIVKKKGTDFFDKMLQAEKDRA